MPVAASLTARLRKLEAANRAAAGEDRPCVVVYATDRATGPDGNEIVTGDADAAVTQARAAMPRHRPVYALPCNGRGDGPKVWGPRSGT